MWGSRTSQVRTLDRRYRRIRTCLPGEVESSSSPIRRQASDVRYLGGWNVGGQDSRCDISWWNEKEFPSGWNEGEFPSRWNE